MNKAFVRETDPTHEYCPKCGSVGEPVFEVTLETHVPFDKRRSIAATACFCPRPQCDVAYFDMFERVVLASELDHPVYPKDPSAPICACCGLTCDDIEQDVREGGVQRTRRAIDHSRLPDAQCVCRAANGRSCEAYVQKYYFECRNRVERL